MTDGQEGALRQFRDVAAFSGGTVELVDWKYEDGGGWLNFELSVRTDHLVRAADGLPLRDRERFVVGVPGLFPFRPPTLWTRHTRFAGFPHVQWGRQLCLYQSVATEWDPADGAFGFLIRLEEWLEHGARGELDPIGAPLHPPAVYAEAEQMVIPRCDTPPVGATDWFGLARIRVLSERRVDIVGWSPSYGEDVAPPVAAAVLLSTTMPWEFPRTVADLIGLLEERGVSRTRLLLTLQFAVLRNAADTGLYVILGAPMRGVRGAGAPRQHLSAWHLEPGVATGLRLTLEQYSDHTRLQEIGARAEALIWDWAQDATIAWCNVREDRPEIVTRRDHTAPTAWFRGKSITFWGCGALGSHLAEFIVRAGARRVVLCDNGTVGPGILVRQQFDDADVGESKPAALRRRLLRIRDDVEIEVRQQDLVYTALSAPELWADKPDAVIDSTGSRSVLKALEQRWSTTAANRVPLASLVVGPAAERALATVVLPGNPGGPLDVVRKAKLAACQDSRLIGFRDEFWPASSATGKVFQPEPGCSDPTFVGSAADISVLAGSMLNLVARDLQAGTAATGFAHFITRADVALVAHQEATSHHSWEAEPSIVDAVRNYQVRLSQAAWRTILQTIETAGRQRGTLVETGGLLLGERDDAAHVIWVTESTGPPSDSRLSRTAFVCGVQGTATLDARRRTETLGAVRFVGMWHTHPQAPPLPSSVDLNGMRQLVSSMDPPIAKALMVIVGHTPAGPTPAAYLFGREDFVGLPGVSVLPLPRGSAWNRWTNRLRRVTTSLIGRRDENGEQAS